MGRRNIPGRTGSPANDMCDFPEQVAAGNAHGHLVRYDKN